MMECPGTYEPKTILFRGKQKGETVMIDDVPALVCQVCGDTVLEPDVVRHIEKLLHSEEEPSKQYPVFTFMSTPKRITVEPVTKTAR